MKTVVEENLQGYPGGGSWEEYGPNSLQRWKCGVG